MSAKNFPLVSERTTDTDLSSIGSEAAVAASIAQLRDENDKLRLIAVRLTTQTEHLRKKVGRTDMSLPSS